MPKAKMELGSDGRRMSGKQFFKDIEKQPQISIRSMKWRCGL
jgi:hypothetical protein